MSYVSIDEGTATKVNTTTVNTDEERQVVSIGDPSTDASKAPVDATYGLSVDITRSVAIALAAGTAEIGKLAAGTAAIGKLAANSGVDIGDVDILTMPDAVAVGKAAHDSAVSGNPVRVAGKAVLSPKGATIVATGDTCDVTTDGDGILVTKPFTTGADSLSVSTSNTDGASTAFTVFDNAAGTYNYITDVTVYNSSATDAYVDFRDGTAGAVIWCFPAPAGLGTTHSFSMPLKQPTAATALAYDVSGAITTIRISVNGFKSKI